ncbi:ATPase [Halopenitus sp. H-Gu1]|uniref:ATPase n=1 Tax=Halopenitus sp. H-Gu1 TaxID=3242697 RepID=UPI00359D183B
MTSGGISPVDDPRLLVAGGSRVDAGKTTFSVGLLAHLASRGHEPVGVKPRAGNDYWFDHDDYRIATADGRLYGKDARRLATASVRQLDERTDPDSDRSGGHMPAITPESLNPVHRLWRPTPGRTGMLGDPDRTFLCDRIGGGADPRNSRFVVNGAAEEAGLLPADVSDRLPLAEATRVHDLEAFNRVMREAYLPVFDRFVDRIGSHSDAVVMESYADIAIPVDVGGDEDGSSPTIGIDAVAVVAPGHVRIYDGDRYVRAREVASGSAREGTREEHTEAVTAMIEPVSRAELPALSGDARGDPDRVAAAYADAYEVLVEAI